MSEIALKTLNDSHSKLSFSQADLSSALQQEAERGFSSLVCSFCDLEIRVGLIANDACKLLSHVPHPTCWIFVCAVAIAFPDERR